MFCPWFLVIDRIFFTKATRAVIYSPDEDILIGQFGNQKVHFTSMSSMIQMITPQIDPSKSKWAHYETSKLIRSFFSRLSTTSWHIAPNKLSGHAWNEGQPKIRISKLRKKTMFNHCIEKEKKRKWITKENICKENGKTRNDEK